MIKNTTVNSVVDVPAQHLWATIAQGGGVDKWFGAVITSCELKGNGQGAQRFCTMADGAELEERILEIDNDKKRFVYAIDKHPLPATDFIAALEIADIGDGQSKVTWSAKFNADNQNGVMVEGMLAVLYEQGIQSLAAYCRKNVIGD